MYHANMYPLEDADACKIKTVTYDISISLGCVATYPGDRQFNQEWVARSGDGAGYSLSALSMSSHAGTHLDAPSHIIKGGKPLDMYPPGRFIVPAHVLFFDGKDDAGPIPVSALNGLKKIRGEALLFKTKNSSRRLLHSPKFSKDYVYLSKDAAQVCVSMGVSLVGIDCFSVDRYGDDSAPVHRILLENDVLILEGIDLADVSPGRYSLICLPLKVKDAEASPVRAVLVNCPENHRP
ncbi:MAG: Kynurenine formamidase [Methanosaeta sp. PtaB.Bin018]|jgi:arylformamidase|nr:cyclase family protein [Methanothrix sp.]OPX74238.1 MAG: Kynurenine formamidase [Methanosaeta sp. PtaB.Bin018]OPY48029.1 MAG: Kynurenine formamidase [Methanosaeta sp. PtaU1.Bin016]